MNKFLLLRKRIAEFRGKYDFFYRRKLRREWERISRENLPYEKGESGYWSPCVLSAEETMRRVIDERLSISRFGDGEFDMAMGRAMGFERANPEMQKRIREVLARPIERWLCCIPDIFASLDAYVDKERNFWRKYVMNYRREIFPLLDDSYRAATPRAFGDAQVSRPYLRYSDKSCGVRVFALWKELFRGRDLLIVEGRFTRMGIGNDLFSEARSVRRIWCPPIGAFSRYDEILAAVRTAAKPGDLILLALGATATIMAYDLAKLDYQAIDAGHLDIEYIHMLRGLDRITPISGRYVNECGDAGKEMLVQADEESANNVIGVIL